MSILLLGKEGQVGQALYRRLEPWVDCHGLTKEQADLSDNNRLMQQLESYHPTVIINAGAYTQVKKAQIEPILAEQINGHSLTALSEFALKRSALLIHYSTDYVFSGDATQAYVENDATSPLNAYGRSKLIGEQQVLASRCKALIFRTSWVYSTTGNNFLKMVLNKAHEVTQAEFVADQIGTPTSAELIADFSLLAIAHYYRHNLAPGIYHLTADGQCSWHQFASYIVSTAAALGASLTLKAQAIKAITSEHFTQTWDTPPIVRRPKNSCLNTEKITQALGVKPAHWQHHTKACIEQYLAAASKRNNHDT